MSILKIGDSGEAVKEVQEALVKSGLTLVVDGIFGEETRQIVHYYQAASGLEPDGIVGPLTAAKLGLGTAPVVAPSTGATPKFIDVSHYEPSVNYKLVAAAGYIGVGIKSTEGVTYVDASQHYHISGAAANGLPFFDYHFLRFNRGGKEQAQFYLSHSLATRHCVDFEFADGKAGADAEAMQILRDCCAEIKAQTGQDPIIYFSTGFVMGLPAADFEFLNQHRCWVAAYAEHVLPPKQIKNILGWQFQYDPNQKSYKEEVPGAGLIDVSYYYGSDFAKECGA